MSVFTEVVLILATGIVAGIINVMAAGGSLLTLPVLIFLGLPSSVANGTNRIAIVVMSMTATTNFYRKGYFDKKLGPVLAIPGIIGAIVGANLAITISDKLFNTVLAIMMVITVIFILWNPSKRLSQKKKDKENSKWRLIIAILVFFFIGIYGGFIQAGAGFFMITALTAIFGLSLVRSNAIKTFVSGVYVLVSLLIFIYHGEVNWLLGVTLAVGMSIGGWIGSSLAVSKGEKLIRVFLVVAVVGMAIKLLFF
ncbi:hypothetical protein EV207_11942 [Scopulibacillus darangshiensis]|uniref:Probable membrane transporter protein n=1 Tax=Scopulibacillus darangshiensis TaxID=442528 RepID=A0A4R2NYK8_9BACL|nr:sulfite exporter TauE/SafE family protein [Scopulibacillus darangshiensis]TCP26611.1 hypothetical protein EV207_11942 [Scopulibacillus darangshiensis]